jgi:hypothetical protein
MRDLEGWETRRNTTDSGADRSDRKFENDNHRRSQEQSDDMTGDSLREDHVCHNEQSFPLYMICIYESDSFVE